MSYYTIILNKSNVVQDGNNNRLVYSFPVDKDLTGMKIALSSVNMYYCWTNINSTPLANNTYTYTWRVGSTDTTYQVVMADGIYQVFDINTYFQFVMINNGHYLINPAGQYVFYAEWVLNTVSYTVQMNTYPVPTSLPSGWTQPSNFAGFPAVNYNSVVKITSNFNAIVGFPAVFTSVNNQGNNSILSYVSTTTPQVAPNPNIFLTCAEVSNEYYANESVIYSIAPSVSVGQQIVEHTYYLLWNRLNAGHHKELHFSFLGSDGTPIKLLDPNINMVLVITAE